MSRKNKNRKQWKFDGNESTLRKPERKIIFQRKRNYGDKNPKPNSNRSQATVVFSENIKCGVFLQGKVWAKLERADSKVLKADLWVEAKFWEISWKHEENAQWETEGSSFLDRGASDEGGSHWGEEKSDY